MNFTGSLNFLDLKHQEINHVLQQIVNANKEIKLRLKFISRFEDSKVYLIEFEAICLNVRKIIEIFSRKILIYLHWTTDLNIPVDIYKNYN